MVLDCIADTIFTPTLNVGLISMISDYVFLVKNVRTFWKECAWNFHNQSINSVYFQLFANKKALRGSPRSAFGGKKDGTCVQSYENTLALILARRISGHQTQVSLSRCTLSPFVWIHSRLSYAAKENSHWQRRS